MNLQFDMTVLECMSEGVILLNRSGQITDFNRAAGPWLNQCFNAKGDLTKLINETIRAKTKDPVPVKFFSPGDGHTSPLKAYLCGNGATDYALFIARILQPATAPAAVTEMSGGFELLGKEIRHEMTQLRDELSVTSANLSTRDLSAVTLRADRLSRLFVAVDQLSRLSQAGTVTQGERLSLVPLIHEVLADMTNQRADFSINLPPGDSLEQQGVLYGDADWLRCGLRALLEGIADSGPPRSHIELRVRQSGGFAVLSGSFANAGTQQRVASAAPVDPAHAALRTEKDIRAPIARRIFELHGGQLKISTMDSDNPDEFGQGIETFTLILPTGVPAPGQHRSPDCANCPQALQTEAYARDLAFMTQGQAGGAEVSGAEIEFLLRVLK